MIRFRRILKRFWVPMILLIWPQARRDIFWHHATEGVPGRHHRPVWFDAMDSEGRAMRAFSLMAGGFRDGGNPSRCYITLIGEGARQHGLPRIGSTISIKFAPWKN